MSSRSGAVREPATGRGAERSLCGWSPPPSAADTPLKRAVDRFMPRTGISVCLYFAAVAGLMLIAPRFPKPAELALDGAAAAAGAAWCGVNFWRCRHAHCLLTVSGWLALAAFDFAEALLGRSLVHGDEQLVFLAVLAAGLGFECAWYRARGTNAFG